MLNSTNNRVDKLWITIVELLDTVVKHVHNSAVVPTQKLASDSYTHVIQVNTTAFVNSLFDDFLSVNFKLPTLSTKPITTTYINKIGRHLINKQGAEA